MSILPSIIERKEEHDFHQDTDYFIDESGGDEEEEEEDSSEFFAPFQQPVEPSSSVTEEADDTRQEDPLSLGAILFREGIEWMKRRAPHTASLLFAKAAQWKPAASPHQPMLYDFKFSSSSSSSKSLFAATGGADQTNIHDDNNYKDTDDLMKIIASQPLTSLVTQGSMVLNSLIDELRTRHVSTIKVPPSNSTIAIGGETKRTAVASTAATATSSPIIVSSAGSMFTPVVKARQSFHRSPSFSRETSKRIRSG